MPRLVPVNSKNGDMFKILPGSNTLGRMSLGHWNDVNLSRRQANLDYDATNGTFKLKFLGINAGAIVKDGKRLKVERGDIVDLQPKCIIYLYGNRLAYRLEMDEESSSSSRNGPTRFSPRLKQSEDNVSFSKNQSSNPASSDKHRPPRSRAEMKGANPKKDAAFSMNDGIVSDESPATPLRRSSRHQLLVAETPLPPSLRVSQTLLPPSSAQLTSRTRRSVSPELIPETPLPPPDRSSPSVFETGRKNDSVADGQSTNGPPTGRTLLGTPHQAQSSSSSGRSSLVDLDNFLEEEVIRSQPVTPPAIRGVLEWPPAVGSDPISDETPPSAVAGPPESAACSTAALLRNSSSHKEPANISSQRKMPVTPGDSPPPPPPSDDSSGLDEPLSRRRTASEDFQAVLSSRRPRRQGRVPHDGCDSAGPSRPPDLPDPAADDGSFLSPPPRSRIGDWWDSGSGGVRTKAERDRLLASVEKLRRSSGVGGGGGTPIGEAVWSWAELSDGGSHPSQEVMCGELAPPPIVVDSDTASSSPRKKRRPLPVPNTATATASSCAASSSAATHPPRSAATWKSSKARSALSTIPTTTEAGGATASTETGTCVVCLAENIPETSCALLEGCGHVFCFDCIRKWSKIATECPLCKKPFHRIGRCCPSQGGVLVESEARVFANSSSTADSKSLAENTDSFAARLAQRTGSVVEWVKVTPKKQRVSDMGANIPEGGCIHCGSDDDESVLLICDGCDIYAHTYCLSPPLAAVPANEWYCDECRSSAAGAAGTSAVMSSSTSARHPIVDLSLSPAVDVVTVSRRGSRRTDASNARRARASDHSAGCRRSRGDSSFVFEDIRDVVGAGGRSNRGVGACDEDEDEDDSVGEIGGVGAIPSPAPRRRRLRQSRRPSSPPPQALFSTERSSPTRRRRLRPLSESRISTSLSTIDPVCTMDRLSSPEIDLTQLSSESDVRPTKKRRTTTGREGPRRLTATRSETRVGDPVANRQPSATRGRASTADAFSNAAEDSEDDDVSAVGYHRNVPGKLSSSAKRNCDSDCDSSSSCHDFQNPMNGSSSSLATPNSRRKRRGSNSRPSPRSKRKKMNLNNCTPSKDGSSGSRPTRSNGSRARGSHHKTPARESPSPDPHVGGGRRLPGWMVGKGKSRK